MCMKKMSASLYWRTEATVFWLDACLLTAFGETTALQTDDLTVAMPYEEGREQGLSDSGKAEPFLTCSPYSAGTLERNDWNRGYHETSGQVGAGSAVGKV